MSGQTVGILIVILVIALVVILVGPGRGWIRKSPHKGNSGFDQ